MGSFGYFRVSIRSRVLYHITNKLESPWFKFWRHIYPAVLQPPPLTGLCLSCHFSRPQTILSRAAPATDRSLSPIAFALLARYAVVPSARAEPILLAAGFLLSATEWGSFLLIV